MRSGGFRNGKQTGGWADVETGRRKPRRQTSPSLPFCLSPRLNNPQSEIRIPQFHSSPQAFGFDAARGEDFFRGAKAVVERLLEERDAGEVCVREVNRTEGPLSFLARAAPQKARARAYHRVPPAHHVEPSRERAYVLVCAREV